MKTIDIAAFQHILEAICEAVERELDVAEFIKLPNEHTELFKQKVEVLILLALLHNEETLAQRLDSDPLLLYVLNGRKLTLEELLFFCYIYTQELEFMFEKVIDSLCRAGAFLVELHNISSPTEQVFEIAPNLSHCNKTPLRKKECRLVASGLFVSFIARLVASANTKPIRDLI
ncbi:MAG: hypothetical protein ACTTKZ_06115 [Bacteroides sp.]